MAKCAKIVGTGSYLPKQRISNQKIEEMVSNFQTARAAIYSIGNTSGASVAISLDMAIRGNVKALKINSGDKVGLTAIAGGYSAGAIVFEY